MAQRVTVWHGTDEDLYNLRKSVDHNCACNHEAQITCEPHKMLEDQAALDRLAFMATITVKLLQEEHDPRSEWF